MNHNQTDPKMRRGRYLTALTASFILLHPAALLAEEVWLNPGYINGIVQIDGSTINYAYLNAVSGEFKATSYTSSGEYTLTVNTPVDGGYTYETSSFVYADNRRDYLHIPHENVFVRDNEITYLDFDIIPAYVNGSFNVESGCSIAGGRVYASADGSASVSGYMRDSTLWVGSRTLVDSDGIFSFPVVPGNNITLSAYVLRGNGEQVNLAAKTLDLAAGQTSEVHWNIPCGGLVTSTIYGSIGLNGTDNFTSHKVQARKDGAGAYINADIFCEGLDCSYEFTGITPGTWQIYPAVTELNGDDDEFRYPRAVHDYEVTVAAGQSLRNDIVAQAAYINGNIKLTGVKSIQDAEWAEIMAYGKYNTLSYAGWTSDFINSLNGDFDLVVSEGDWSNFYSRFYFFNNDRSDYLRSYLYVYDYSMPFWSMSAGEVAQSDPIEHQTGSVTVRYTVDNNGVLSSPSLTGNATTDDGKYSYVYAYGLPDQTTEGLVTFIGLPGSYSIKAEAYVGGSRTTFGELQIDVIYGGERALDIGSPLLSVESPLPEEYTENLSVLVSGTTTDENGIRDIVINGESSEFSATANPNDVNEVYYSKEVALEPGPNKIEITVTDNLNKSITDTRSVYVDNEYPAITWEPSDATTTVLSAIQVRGTATDDNSITSVTVNGKEVSFTSTLNPLDPNEVEFSTEINLETGTNRIIVAASDNCKLSTSETRALTRIEPDTSAPVLNCPADQTFEFGDSITLGQASATDNTDPSPKISNNAPEAFFLGKTEVTWTAQDNWGNSSACVQNITLVDTQPPNITCPADISIADGDEIELPLPSAKDNADSLPVISSDKPETFPAGSTYITWSATDASGNSAKCEQLVQVSEKVVEKAAIIEQFLVKTDLDTIWPPNHKYVQIDLSISALSSLGEEMGDLALLESVTSDEMEDAKEMKKKENGDGNTINDIVIIDNNTVLVRAERAGGGDGRVYTFNYSIVAPSGETSRAAASISVPLSPKKAAVDSGVKYKVVK